MGASTIYFQWWPMACAKPSDQCGAQPRSSKCCETWSLHTTSGPLTAIESFSFHCQNFWNWEGCSAARGGFSHFASSSSTTTGCSPTTAEGDETKAAGEAARNQGSAAVLAAALRATTVIKDWSCLGIPFWWWVCFFPGMRNETTWFQRSWRVNYCCLICWRNCTSLLSFAQ